MTTEKIAYKLLQKFQQSLEQGEYKDLPYRQELAQALLILIDSRNDNFQQLVANIFYFGYHLAKHHGLEDLEQEISEEQQAEMIKRCINCNSLTASSGTLKCKLEKCKYE